MKKVKTYACTPGSAVNTFIRMMGGMIARLIKNRRSLKSKLEDALDYNLGLATDNTMLREEFRRLKRNHESLFNMMIDVFKTLDPDAEAKLRLGFRLDDLLYCIWISAVYRRFDLQATVRQLKEAWKENRELIDQLEDRNKGGGF